MCWSKVTKYFRKRKMREEIYEQLAEDIKSPKKKEKYQGQLIKTSRGGLNMPKHQPCPQCHSNSKRSYKTSGGAPYQCRTHGAFFVRAPQPWY